MTAEDKELIKDIKLIANAKESTNQDKFLLLFIETVCEKYHKKRVNSITDKWVQDEAKEFSENYNSPYHNSAKHGFKVGASLYKDKLLKQ